MEVTRREERSATNGCPPHDLGSDRTRSTSASIPSETRRTLCHGILQAPEERRLAPGHSARMYLHGCQPRHCSASLADVLSKSGTRATPQRLCLTVYDDAPVPQSHITVAPSAVFLSVLSAVRTPSCSYAAIPILLRVEGIKVGRG